MTAKPKRLRAVGGLLVGLTMAGFAGDASAACREDLEQVKEQLANLRDVRKKDLVKREISAADTALKNHNEQSCALHVDNANKLLRARP